MAFANIDVAHRLFTHPDKDCKGSHFRVERCSDQPFIAGFAVHSLVYSYSTVIAQLMVREDGHGHELWLTIHRYSSTTDRHMSHLRGALFTHNSTPNRGAHAVQPISGAVPSYYTPQVTSYALTNRCSAALLREANQHARNNLVVADAPRLHAHTREAHLHGARRLLTEALFRATNCMPQQAVRTYPDLPEAIEATQAHIAYVERLIALPIEQARVCIRAVNDLNKD